MQKNRILLVAALCLAIIANSQEAYHSKLPKIGKASPDFIFTDVKYYHKSKLSLKDVKGKWTLLDFWSTGCKSCVASFPKVNKLQQQFKDKVKIVLVGYDDAYIRPSFEKFRQKQQLDLTIAFDTAAFKTFSVWSVPRVFWIDPDGIIRGVTTGSDVNEENIQAFLDGKEPRMITMRNEQDEENFRKQYNTAIPLLTDGNGGPDTAFLFRSLLSRFDSKITPPTVLGNVAYSIKNGLFQGTGFPLASLYKLAYYGFSTVGFPSLIDTVFYGKYSPNLLLEIDDKSAFTPNNATNEHLYNYSLKVPVAKADPKKMQEILQRDLKSYFGYDVIVESRQLPCWILTAPPSARLKLKTKTNNASFTDKYGAGFCAKNYPVVEFLLSVQVYHQFGPVFLDETGIEGNIDLCIDAILTDLNDVQKSLKKIGLNLEKGMREMKTIVIRDPNN